MGDADTNVAATTTEDDQANTGGAPDGRPARRVRLFATPPVDGRAATRRDQPTRPPASAWRPVEAAIPPALLTSPKFGSTGPWLVVSGAWGWEGAMVNDGCVVYAARAVSPAVEARLLEIMLANNVPTRRSAHPHAVCLVVDRASGHAWVGGLEASLRLATHAARAAAAETEMAAAG